MIPSKSTGIVVVPGIIGISVLACYVMNLERNRQSDEVLNIFDQVNNKNQKDIWDCQLKNDSQTEDSEIENDQEENKGAKKFEKIHLTPEEINRKCQKAISNIKKYNI